MLFPASYTTSEINGISISEAYLFWNVSFGNDKEYDFPWLTGIVENDNKSQYNETKYIYCFVCNFCRIIYIMLNQHYKKKEKQLFSPFLLSYIYIVSNSFTMALYLLSNSGYFDFNR